MSRKKKRKGVGRPVIEGRGGRGGGEKGGYSLGRKIVGKKKGEEKKSSGQIGNWGGGKVWRA